LALIVKPDEDAAAADADPVNADDNKDRPALKDMTRGGSAVAAQS